MNDVEFLIIGGGPTGIGAALRLAETDREWALIEAEPHFGGLSASFRDEPGFTWDLGGHVLFSHYDTFDRYMDAALGRDGWFDHERESWVWMRQRFIPYPLQNNLHRLPPKDRWACVKGLLDLRATTTAEPPADFEAWITRTFGEGLADAFMRPYNQKVWAYPPAMMDWQWIGERVAVVSLEQVLRGICLDQDDVSWGPNRTFRFPKHGGTGAIWQALGQQLPAARVTCANPVTAIDPVRRTVTARDGATWHYKRLISTLPLNTLLSMCGSKIAPRVDPSRLLFSSTHVVGVGMTGQPPAALRTKCWMYFPEDTSPYYRVTVFSNYSRFNVPQPDTQWSLMAEVSASSHKPVDSNRVVADVVAALRQDGLIPEGTSIISTVHRHVSPGYPTPFCGRDALVVPLLDALELEGIFSRGRFGAWKYEVANQDHSFAQGYECAARLLGNHGPEAEPTLRTPGLVNARRNP